MSVVPQAVEQEFLPTSKQISRYHSEGESIVDVSATQVRMGLARDLSMCLPKTDDGSPGARTLSTP